MNKWDRGYVQIYTGNGKGKTTAAIGLAVRAACSGKKVYIGQFIKGMKYNEVDLEEYMPNIKFEQYGQNCFINQDPSEEDKLRAKKGLEKVRQIIGSEDYDMVILDEITIALFYKLLSLEELVDLIDKKPRNVELIITGRYAPKELIEKADLVTEMKEVKHYYRQGVAARDGIER